MRFFRPSVDAAKALLTTAGLPTDDLPERLDHFLACGDPSDPDGIVGLEIFGENALLRSLVVNGKKRGSGLGRALVAAIETRAADRNVRRIFLLTDTAEDFFTALGYEHADRQTAPEPVRDSRQFSELCPSSAAFMEKDLETASS